MKVVALISGGKDSCYAMMQCVAAGHEVVALANLWPQGKDELDSYMFQTVGHEGVSLYAEAMDFPLYRAPTLGLSRSREMEYRPCEGDEVEDLYQLLKRVKEEVGVEAVSSGAVLSNYQRLRVESICSRLGLVSLAYLWRREQAELLREMVDVGVRAIVIKVAALGLGTQHLGKTVEELYPHLLELNEKYGINVCGEGGEYETFTLDCPLFKHEIIIDNSEVCVHSDDAFAPVAFLKLREMHLKSKTNLLVPPISLRMAPLSLPTQCVCRPGYLWIAMEGDGQGSVADLTQRLFCSLQDTLDQSGCGWSSVVLAYLYLSDMADYSLVNAVYVQYFPSQPPARVCIQSSLCDGVQVKVELLACGESQERGCLHVQSISHWAPANIGPYSQAYTVDEVVYTAGQIGLVPGSMELAREAEQPSLALTHVLSVLQACHAHLNSALCGLCYFTCEEAGSVARATWNEYVKSSNGCTGCAVAFAHVPGLPRGANVEWHFTAVKSMHPVKYQCESTIEEGVGVVTVSSTHCSELALGCWMVDVACLPRGTPDLSTALMSGLKTLQASLAKSSLSLTDMTLLRVLMPKYGVEMGPKVQALMRDPVWGDSPLSLLQTEAFYGCGTPITLQACLLHRRACDVTSPEPTGP